ncbi:uncharacterized protein N7484_004485 [Penicillium longicatenatum]|uniref:uncharacterized protein n=1 Tax=Penicillium longicatenatum TaxID=1561947 RepID=UPI00254879C8|nr:uncharacterized protein N7484_004485 [Penicillium longicatenatum]KAJ5650762.1 hypothetical protein N7484_004485 [Penicillium longicatenatum]
MATTRTDATRIRDDMATKRQNSWGFCFYRTCYYDDDTRWESFLERMKAFAKMRLLDSRTENKNGDGEFLLGQLEWNVQSDPSLDNSSYEEVWRRHRDLMKSLQGEYCPAFVRQGYPVVVDKEALDSVLEASSPDAWTPGDNLRTMAYVNVLDMQWFDAQDEPDNGIGSEVGWTRVSAHELYPRLHSLLADFLWPQVIYRDPPTISRLR